jgi:integrase
MTQQRQAQAVISREVARLGRLLLYPVHPGYAAIVAKAHALGLPQRYATDITIHDRLLIILERQQTVHPNTQYVFVSSHGTAIDPRNLLRRFKRALERAKLPATTRFHDLQHSCATFLIAQGEHPRVVMEILGHAQMSTTMDIYGHVLPSTQRAAATSLDALLGEAADSNEQAE